MHAALELICDRAATAPCCSTRENVLITHFFYALAHALPHLAVQHEQHAAAVALAGVDLVHAPWQAQPHLTRGKAAVNHCGLWRAVHPVHLVLLCNTLQRDQRRDRALPHAACNQ